MFIWAFLHFGNVQCPILTVEGPDTTHVVSVLCVFFTTKTVPRVVWKLVYTVQRGITRQSVEKVGDKDLRFGRGNRWR